MKTRKSTLERRGDSVLPFRRVFVMHFFRVARPWLALVAAMVVGGPAAAQDKVQYREAGHRGAVQTASGKIDAESIAGVQIGSRLIPSGDIIDVQYEVPALIRLDYPRAVAAETRSPAEAIREYEGLLKSPSLDMAPFVRRHFEYKLAALAAALAEGDQPESTARAIEAIQRFRKEHPNSWQVVPLTLTLTRLLLEKTPPDTSAARRSLQDLARNPKAPADVRANCALQIVDLLLDDGKAEEARRELAAMPAGDPRIPVYEVGCAATNANRAESVRRLQAIIDRTNDRLVKAAAYNMLGDYLRRDPATRKDALYAYLWVDVVYNDDPAQTTKAVSRLAELFAELKDEPRARKYRERLRGRP